MFTFSIRLLLGKMKHSRIETMVMKSKIVNWHRAFADIAFCHFFWDGSFQWFDGQRDQKIPFDIKHKFGYRDMGI